MTRFRLLVTVIGLSGWLTGELTPASAQMFGERQVGGPISPRSGPGSAGSDTAVGTLRNQRFMRGNRSRSNFVGADRGETRQFVGMQQSSGAGNARSAVAGLNGAQDGSTQINQVYPRPSANQLYAPRYQVEWERQGIRQGIEAKQLAQQITRHLHRLPSSIAVSVADREATLRGEVASEEQRRLAELLVGFEPGISAVRNELQVAGDNPTLPEPPPDPTLTRQSP